MSKTTPMRLKARVFNGLDTDGKPKVFSRGDVVELTDSQLMAFSDKFEDPALQAKVVVETPKQQTPAPAPAPTPGPKPTVPTPGPKAT